MNPTSNFPPPVPFADSYLGKLRSVIGPRLVHSPVFRVVLERADGSILMQFRADFRVWGIPGGHPEEGESILDCARRETFEETGLIVGELEAFGYSSAMPLERTRYPNGDLIHSFALLLHAKDWMGVPIESNEESLALAFRSPDALPDEMLPCERDSVRKFLAWRATGRFQLD